jgi:hypothetical protein
MMFTAARFIEFICPNDHNGVIIFGWFPIYKALSATGIVSTNDTDRA